MIDLEDLIKTVNILHERGLNIPDHVNEKLREYEREFLKDELTRIFNKSYVAKIQNLIKREYQLVINYSPDSDITFDFLPKDQSFEPKTINKSFSCEIIDTKEKECIITDSSTENIGEVKNCKTNSFKHPVLPNIHVSKKNDMHITTADKNNERKKIDKTETLRKEELKLVEHKLESNSPKIESDIECPSLKNYSGKAIRVSFRNGVILYYKDLKRLFYKFAKYVGIEKLFKIDKSLVFTQIPQNTGEDAFDYSYVMYDSCYSIKVYYNDYRRSFKILCDLTRALRLDANVEIFGCNHNTDVENKNNQLDPVQVKVPHARVIEEPVRAKEMSICAKEKPILKSKKEVREKPIQIKRSIEKGPKRSASDYRNLIQSVNRATIKEHKAPHKLILLLSIIDLIRYDVVEDNRFYFDYKLTECFAENWNIHVRNKSLFVENVSTPFVALSHDGFWHLELKDNSCSIPKTITNKWIIENVEYAYLDESLFRLFHGVVQQNRFRLLITAML